MDQGIDFRTFARAVATVADYARNDVIFREGDAPRCMYIVLSGSVEISSHGKVIETIHDGNALGILSLLDEQPRSTTARAREACQLAIMDRRKFRYMVEEVPNFVWYVMNELAHRLRTTNAAL
ncbi:MAG: family transcriptional regulator, cyclic receptor protein [Acetobacteraceae bacterium]|jgi:CRP/FNR family cyclic AMP-dependent transcriptional regulator|nr:family transcriptional regulator, cyclic receptor protein [Acetobacteraceae bacterium]